jgi:hypothetical protein
MVQGAREKFIILLLIAGKRKSLLQDDQFACCSFWWNEEITPTIYWSAASHAEVLADILAAGSSPA